MRASLRPEGEAEDGHEEHHGAGGGEANGVAAGGGATRKARLGRAHERRGAKHHLGGSQKGNPKHGERDSKGPQPWRNQYANNIGLGSQIVAATKQYAGWSVAAELRLLSKEAMTTEKLSAKDIKEYCDRGLPWKTKLVKIEDQNGKE